MKKRKINWIWDKAALALDKVRLEARIDSVTLEVLKIEKGHYNWTLSDDRLVGTDSLLHGIADTLSRAQQVAELALFSPTNFMFSSKEALV